MAHSISFDPHALTEPREELLPATNKAIRNFIGGEWSVAATTEYINKKVVISRWT